MNKDFLETPDRTCRLDHFINSVITDQSSTFCIAGDPTLHDFGRYLDGNAPRLVNRFMPHLSSSGLINSGNGNRSRSGLVDRFDPHSTGRSACNPIPATGAG